MVTMALARCLPGAAAADWTPLLLPQQGKPVQEAEFMTGLSGKTDSALSALQELDQVESLVGAIRRAVKWVLGMQCRNGGWAAFDADNTRELLTQVPIADHNAIFNDSARAHNNIMSKFGL